MSETNLELKAEQQTRMAVTRERQFGPWWTVDGDDIRVDVPSAWLITPYLLPSSSIHLSKGNLGKVADGWNPAIGV
jgi:hypothetical protein